ncbi:hypothetical protein ANCCAN_00781 [Ancylostoma caninum]|uniref:Uncharacterized protein n=1 Tax=Ancylostoma caninum TaxID=29170 RepID=A0A368H9D4_ANCCA|nr:hypothetical protein ANCCAN_00781 [Ancylostoma caninum]
MFYLFLFLSLATSSFMILLSSLLFCCNCKRPEKSESHLPPPSRSTQPGSSESGRFSSETKGASGESFEKSKPVPEKKPQKRESEIRKKQPKPSQEDKESKEAKPKQPAVPDTEPVQLAAAAAQLGGDEGYDVCPDLTPEELAKALGEMK